MTGYHPGDVTGYDYEPLLAPDGSEVAVLTEPEDRTWGRDLAPVVTELNCVWGWVMEAQGRAEKAEVKLDLARQLAIGVEADELAAQFGGLGYENESPAKEIAELWLRAAIAEAEVERLREKLIDAWHHGAGRGMPLAAWIGMTNAEYAAWVERVPEKNEQED